MPTTHLLAFLLLACLGSLAGADDLSADPARWRGGNDLIKASRQAEGPEGRDGLRIRATQPQWHLLRRHLIFAAPVARVVLTAEICAQGIAAGAQPWHAGRLGLRFLDAEGNELGAEPPLAACRTGTTAWTPVRQELAAPAGTRALRLEAGLPHTTGTFFLRQLSVEAVDGGGAPLAPAAQEGVRTDTSGWLPLAIAPEDPARPLVFDFSALRPAPAGRDGFVRREGAAFTAGGRPIRFWGENIGWKVLDWTRPELERQADWLARTGCNIMRLPFLDNSWGNNLFINGGADTLRLDAERLERIDFFVAECRKRGIYLYADLLVYRQFRRGDGVRDWDRLAPGAPVACLFNRRLIELQKEYARALFGHVNPHTGLRWADDPAIAAACMINENTTFYRDGIDQLPPSYQAELEERFAAWCQAGGRAKPAAPLRELARRPDATAFAFLKQVQDDYFAEMHAFLRKELGVKFLLAGSNHWENHVGDIRSNAAFDLLDRHSYWDHPASAPYTELSVFHGRPMVKARTRDNLIAQNARQRVLGMPLLVSEWTSCWPNEHCGEVPLLMAANGLFQDWQGLIHFSSEECGWDAKLASCFNTRSKPQQVAPLAACALMWLRGDVAPGPRHAFPAGGGGLDAALGEAIPAATCVGARTAAVLDGEVPPPGAGTPFGRQIAWSDDGVFTVDTPCTKAVLGFAGGRTVALDGCTLSFAAPFGQLIATSLDHRPLAESRHLLLCAIARVENTGQVFNDFKRGLLDAGRAPMLLEPLPCRAILRRQIGAAGTPHLYAVDWYGRRVPGALPLTSDGDGLTMVLDGKAGYAWYEVAVE
ncbi:MAG: hypothetical protein L6R48_06320 [Planctomycetes bacterium]|nr:hypothetical protein [Planctomycetota bacterium]